MQSAPLLAEHPAPAVTAVPPPLPTSVVVPPPLPPAVAATPKLDYYALDGRKIRFREWWISVSPIMAILGWGLGRLGVNLIHGQKAPVIHDWRQHEVAPESLRDDVRRRFTVSLNELHQLGFAATAHAHLSNPVNGYDDSVALLAGPSGITMARIFWSRGKTGEVVRERFEIGFLTLLADGRGFWTVDRPLRFDLPPQISATSATKRSIAELLRLHESRVAAALLHGGQPTVIRTVDDLWTTYAAYEAALDRDQIERGILRKLDEQESAVEAAAAAEETRARTEGSRFPEAWAQLQRIQAPTRSAINPFVLLVCSAVAAGLIGFGDLTWDKTAILLGILFFHELGHFLAMRSFGYRNLKMFFIPGLGAAVTGRNFNVPGWKRAVVSLMGPVPGIWLGVIFAIVGALWKIEFLSFTGFMAIVLNGINLLPVLPMDGGWFWNAIVFSRHPWLEILFKASAAVCCILASAAHLGRIWFYLGVAGLVGLSVSFMQGEIIRRVRQRLHNFAADTEDRIPLPMAEEIFAETEARLKGKTSPKLLASNALAVFERLNARPPGALASFGLVSVYAVTLLMGLLGLASPVLLVPGKLQTVMAQREERLHPKLVEQIVSATYAPEDLQVSPVQRPDDHYSNWIVATFADAETARTQYEALIPHQRETDALIRVGSIVLTAVSIPEIERGRLDPAIADGAEKALVQAGGRLLNPKSVRTAAPTMTFQVVAPSPEVGADLRDVLSDWFTLRPDLRGSAPWLAPIAPEVRDSMHTYAVYQRQITDANREYYRQHVGGVGLLATLFRSQGDRARILEKRRAEAAQRRRAVADQLLASHDPHLDPAELSHEATFKLVTTPEEHLSQQRELYRLIHHRDCPIDDGAKEPADAPSCYGGVSGSGVHVTLEWISPPDLSTHFSKVLEWLAAQGCSVEVRLSHDPNSTIDWEE